MSIELMTWSLLLSVRPPGIDLDDFFHDVADIIHLIGVVASAAGHAVRTLAAMSVALAATDERVAPVAAIQLVEE
jgi:hypothetical protein